MRDLAAPESLRPSFKAVCGQLQRGTALEEMGFFTGGSLFALDGTGYFSSTKVPGPSWLEQHPRDGSITYAHQMVGAALMHPDRRAVMPLMPAAIINHDGTEKNDGERHAAQRFIAKVRQDHPHLQFLVTEDGRSAKAPPIDTLQDDGCHDILGVTEGDHASLFEPVRAAEEAGRGTYSERHDRSAGIEPQLRLVHDLPLNESRSDGRVHVIEYWEVSEQKVQHCRWVTDFRVTKSTVYQLMRGGRARWKIATETCNTLQNQGDNCDHTYGHGAQHLSVVLATLMLLAFLVDQTPPLCCGLLRAVWHQLGRKRLLWERLRALFFDDALESMWQLLEALFDGLQKAAPVIAVHASSSLQSVLGVSVGEPGDR
jgi:hypothetical protein